MIVYYKRHILKTNFGTENQAGQSKKDWVVQLYAFAIAGIITLSIDGDSKVIGISPDNENHFGSLLRNIFIRFPNMIFLYMASVTRLSYFIQGNISIWRHIGEVPNPILLYFNQLIIFRYRSICS